MTPFEVFSITGSAASILGLLVSLFVLLKEYVLQDNFDVFKKEEEDWHKEEKKDGRVQPSNTDHAGK
jgi:hypothetical protein